MQAVIVDDLALVLAKKDYDLYISAASYISVFGFDSLPPELEVTSIDGFDYVMALPAMEFLTTVTARPSVLLKLAQLAADGLAMSFGLMIG